MEKLDKFENVKSILKQEIADNEKLVNGELDFLLEVAIKGDAAYRCSANIDYIKYNAIFTLWNKDTYGYIDEKEIRRIAREHAIFTLLYEFKDVHNIIFKFITDTLKSNLTDTSEVEKAEFYIKTNTPPTYLFVDLFVANLFMIWHIIVQHLPNLLY